LLILKNFIKSLDVKIERKIDKYLCKRFRCTIFANDIEIYRFVSVVNLLLVCLKRDP